MSCLWYSRQEVCMSLDGWMDEGSALPIYSLGKKSAQGSNASRVRAWHIERREETGRGQVSAFIGMRLTNHRWNQRNEDRGMKRVKREKPAPRPFNMPLLLCLPHASSRSYRSLIPL
mmetsp:Transcript_40462/g.115325  ORF Transcript_40462/g.115325 Transcript_40462/m.115325 type:complete len:117 (-) Transcript_40462:1330-1680(-)